MNSNCGCHKTPCQCHTVCPPMPTCLPPRPGRPGGANVTLAELLRLINTKCDKETCEHVQVQIKLLYKVLGLVDFQPGPPDVGPNPDPDFGHRPEIDLPSKPTPNPDPGFSIKPLPDLAFQLISNMVDSLEGDLEDKYPSAELLKEQLTLLWDCLNTKQTHHGEWEDNFTWRKVTPSTDLCVLGGNEDTAPKAIRVIIPVDAGSTVFNTVNDRRCLYESLEDDNTSVPNPISVAEGKWINYCDIQDVIKCVLPSHIASCTEGCEDDSGTGVIQDPTLCERMDAVEARLTALENNEKEN